jgi:hypothetical protein
MKRLKQIFIALVIAAVLLAFPLGYVMASAEAQPLEIGADYTFSDDGGNYTVTITSETEYSLHAVNPDETETFDFTGTYTYINGELSLIAMGKVLSVFTVDGYALTKIVISETEEIIEDDGAVLDDSIFSEKAPWITALIAFVITAGPSIITAIKNYGKSKAMAAMYSGSTDRNIKYEDALAKKDSEIARLNDQLAYYQGDGLKETMVAAIGEVVEADTHAQNVLTGKVDIVDAKVTALMDGATIAWSADPKAVERLAQSAIDTALQKEKDRNARLIKFAMKTFKLTAEEIEKGIAEGV